MPNERCAVRGGIEVFESRVHGPSGDEVGVVFLVAKLVENGHVAVPTVRCLVQTLRHLLDELQEGGSPRPEDPR
eukprot:scaffold2603_cov225-Pinguiococcus_pyrenoidosus.AAC.4